MTKVDAIILGPMTRKELETAHGALTKLLRLEPEDTPSRTEALVLAARSLRGNERPGREGLTMQDQVRKTWVREVWHAEKLAAEPQRETLERLRNEISDVLAGRVDRT